MFWLLFTTPIDAHRFVFLIQLLIECNWKKDFGMSRVWVFILQSQFAKPTIYRRNLRKLLGHKQNNKLFPALDNFSTSLRRKYHLSSCERLLLYVVNTLPLLCYTSGSGPGCNVVPGKTKSLLIFISRNITWLDKSNYHALTQSCYAAHWGSPDASYWKQFVNPQMSSSRQFVYSNWEPQQFSD